MYKGKTISKKVTAVLENKDTFNYYILAVHHTLKEQKEEKKNVLFALISSHEALDVSSKWRLKGFHMLLWNANKYFFFVLSKY